MTVWHIAKIGATKQPTFALQKHLRLFGQECFLPSGRCSAKKQYHEKNGITPIDGNKHFPTILLCGTIWYWLF